MLLAVDIGNSNIVFGIYQQGSWNHIWRLATSIEKTSSAYAMDISSFFLENDLERTYVERVIISSVVPDVTSCIFTMLTELFRPKPLLIDSEIYPKLQLNIEHPHEIGTDLVANAIAAYDQFQDNCIVVDFGTALTFTTVSEEGGILGVAIAPGLKTAMYSLFASTAQLPDVPLELPESAIGKNTTQALQAGVLLGYVGLVESLIQRIEQELNATCKVIATGGLAVILDPVQHLFTKIDPHLTLEGLRIIDNYYQT